MRQRPHRRYLGARRNGMTDVRATRLAAAALTAMIIDFSMV